MKTISLNEDEVAVVVEQVDLLLYKGKLSQGERAQARKVRKMLVNRLDSKLKPEAKDGDTSEAGVDDVDSDEG